MLLVLLLMLRLLPTTIALLRLMATRRTPLISTCPWLVLVRLLRPIAARLLFPCRSRLLTRRLLRLRHFWSHRLIV
jgi:hypothetical protein